MDKTAVIILAAGQGKRMGGELPKVLARTNEGALIDHVLRTVTGLSPDKTVVVTGYKNELVEQHIVSEGASFGYDPAKITFALQKEQLGTGDAVRAGMTELKDFRGKVMILCGDVPLVKEQTLKNLIDIHVNEKATISLITATTDSPASYGRIIRSKEDGRVLAIKEARDCSQAEYLIQEINAGLYLVDSAFLQPALESLSTENAQKEYYLTDIVQKAAEEGQNIACHILPEIIEAQGVNTFYELQKISQEILRRNVEELIKGGVRLLDTNTFYCDTTCTIESGAQIGPNVTLLGNCQIASGVVIEGSAWIKDCVIREGAHLKFGVRAEEAIIGEGASVGPFAHLRPESVLEKDVKVGNFVETKKALLREGAKASHLTYLGDVEVGKNANIGAGTITCNYDGYKKSKTVIGEGVFVGSNSSLVAPVTLEKGATVGAGSTITKNIKEDALGLTRADQREIPGWSKKKRERNS